MRDPMASQRQGVGLTSCAAGFCLTTSESCCQVRPQPQILSLAFVRDRACSVPQNAMFAAGSFSWNVDSSGPSGCSFTPPGQLLSAFFNPSSTGAARSDRDPLCWPDGHPCADGACNPSTSTAPPPVCNTACADESFAGMPPLSNSATAIGKGYIDCEFPTPDGAKPGGGLEDHSKAVGVVTTSAEDAMNACDVNEACGYIMEVFSPHSSYMKAKCPQGGCPPFWMLFSVATEPVCSLGSAYQLWPTRIHRPWPLCRCWHATWAIPAIQPTRTATTGSIHPTAIFTGVRSRCRSMHLRRRCQDHHLHHHRCRHTRSRATPPL